MSSTAVREAATEPQINFLKTLMAERELGRLEPRKRQFLERGESSWRMLSKVQASAAITLLKEQPKKQTTATAPNAANFPAVPEGYYFVDLDGNEQFYRVDLPTEGRWAGYTFVSVQASDEWHRIKDPTRKAAILTEIAKDPIKAMNEYGLRLGRCGNCNRTLTNRHSRMRGLGPICAGRLGVS